MHFITRCLLLSLISFYTVRAQVIPWETYPVYTGSDLGLTYTSTRSAFRIYAPTAQQAQLLLYDQGTGGNLLQTVGMIQSTGGTWTAVMEGDQKGKFYAFRVNIQNEWLNEVPDPYVKCVGVNGKRGMIIDLGETNPTAWNQDKSPEFKHPVDAIIYELHIRDASIHASAGITAKGKFIGLAEKGSKNSAGLPTGMDHIKELGVTHVHLLPSYDFNSVDESIPNNPKYNWGYDPLNYNVPEGSYATDAHNGAVRILEFKKLIKTFHENGLRVVLDVVYNHTALTQDSYFNALVPNYYYRQNSDGTFSNGTACGNETASERPMMRKFMLESVLYWVNEYHIDGFRFDLMGVHDMETMNLLSEKLHELRPDILLYGEGWTAGAVQISEAQQALKKNAAKLKDIAVFSDDIRDGIKGSVFDHAERGFATGLSEQAESIKFGVVAACKHPQVDYSKVKYAKAPYAASPGNTTTYCECHDNHVLWDKLSISMPQASEAERKGMHKLALSIVLTSQGISFLHAGTEFLRSKQGVENSFESPDSINAIDWDLKTLHSDVYTYVQYLIALRKAHPAFRMRTTEDLVNNLHFIDPTPEGIVAYTLNGEAVGDSWKAILVAFNGSALDKSIKLPKGNWQVAVKGNMSTSGSVKKSLSLSPYSCSVLFQK